MFRYIGSNISTDKGEVKVDAFLSSESEATVEKQNIGDIAAMEDGEKWVI